MLLLCPAVIFGCKNKYILHPPQGSVFSKAIKLWRLASKGRWIWQTPNWKAAKPSHQAVKPTWMDFDVIWVDEVRRGLLACRVFLWYP